MGFSLTSLWESGKWAARTSAWTWQRSSKVTSLPERVAGEGDFVGAEALRAGQGAAQVAQANVAHFEVQARNRLAVERVLGPEGLNNLINASLYSQMSDLKMIHSSDKGRHTKNVRVARNRVVRTLHLKAEALRGEEGLININSPVLSSDHRVTPS